MKTLAERIKEEAGSEVYNEGKFKELMNNLVMCLTNKRHVMSYEFKESNLLGALEFLLTFSPRQVKTLV